MKYQIKWQYKVLWILIVSVFISACKSRKNSNDTRAFKKLSTMDALSASISDWQFYSAKAKVDIEGAGLSKSVDAVIKMEKDSVIWISVGLFGLEGARIFMHQDSITVLNKLDKSYSKLSWNEAGNYVGAELTLKSTQSLLLGNLLLPVDSLYELNQDSALYYLERIVAKSIYKVKLDSFDYHLVNSYFRGEKTGKNIRFSYSSYEKVDSAFVPGLIELKAKDGLKNFKGKIRLSNMNLEAFGPLPTRIPASYKRI
jgi:hypothetical protein